MNRHQECLNVDMIMDKMIRNYGLLDNINNEKRVNKIVRMINMMFSPRCALCTPSMIIERCEKIKSYQTQLAKLKEIPVIEQRTPEWYEVRKSIVTASDFAQALGEGKFGTQKQFYHKKCGYEEEKFNPSLPPLKWGTMFEPVATTIYQQRFECQVHEFGLIKHPTRSFFGASPDGITDYGIMVEIKCPYKRKITGEVPGQYYYQVQGQLDVCDLQECDYLECEFSCYNCQEEFVQDDEAKYEKGIIVEKSSGYLYSDVIDAEDDPKDLLKWASENNQDAINTIYYKLVTLNIVRIYKDDVFVNSKLDDLGEVWNKVIEYQGDKEKYKNEVGPPRASSTRAVQLTGFAFLPH